MDTVPRARGHLLYTVGLPRSGKSTCCALWLHQHDDRPGTRAARVVLSADDFRLALHGQPFVPSAEPFIHAAVKLAAEALLLSGHDR